MLAAWDRTKSTIQLKHIWWFVVLIGILLRLRQYFANRSLWADEARLALNIVSRSFAELTAPLALDQGAPVGFLLIEKLSIVILGNQDFVLRLFPLLCGLTAVYLMYRVASEYAGVFGLFSLLTFSISSSLIHYSSELKQYSVDVAVALFILLYSFRFLKANVNGRDFFGLAAIGIIAMWFSYPAVFVLAATGITLVYARLAKRSAYPLIWLLATGVLWLVNLWVIFSISVQQLAANDYLQEFWKYDFMPMPPWQHWDWLGRAYGKALSASTGIFRPFPWYFVLSCSITILFGLIPERTNPRNWFTSSLIVLLIPLLLTASALHLYPIDGRFLLFLVPFIILLMANGLHQIQRLVGPWNETASRLLSLALMLGIIWKPMLLAGQNFVNPPLGEHIKPALAVMQENRKDGDLIYVYYGGQPAFDYYRDAFGLDSANVINGVTSREDPEQYILDVDRLRGNDRVWFIFTHNCDTCTVHEQKYYIRHLGKIGTVMRRFHGTGVNLYLYDLKP